MLFILPQKLFSFLKYFNFCSEFFPHVGKRLDKEGKFQNFCLHKLGKKQIQLTVSRYLLKQRQSENEISVNRI